MRFLAHYSGGLVAPNLPNIVGSSWAVGPGSVWFRLGLGLRFRISIGGRVRFWFGPGTQLDPHHVGKGTQ